MQGTKVYKVQLCIISFDHGTYFSVFLIFRHTLGLVVQKGHHSFVDNVQFALINSPSQVKQHSILQDAFRHLFADGPSDISNIFRVGDICQADRYKDQFYP